MVLPRSCLPTESSIDIGATSAADTANVGNTVVVSLATELYLSTFLLAWLMSGNPSRFTWWSMILIVLSSPVGLDEINRNATWVESLCSVHRFDHASERQ